MYSINNEYIIDPCSELQLSLTSKFLWLLFFQPVDYMKHLNQKLNA